MSQDNFSQPDPMFQARLAEQGLRVKIVGVGGAGTNAVDRLKLDNPDRVHLAVVNTDGKTHSASPTPEKLMVGRALTRGLSAGGEAEIGRQAAEADRDSLRKMVDGVDLLFLLAGLGGGTGSGAAPVVASVAAESGAVVIAFVTLPFAREGSRRLKQAEDAVTALRGPCHAVIQLPNDLLMQQMDEQASVLDAFALADDWINRGVRAICSMLFSQGLINLDFATLRKALEHRGGKTLFGLACGEGEDYVKKALRDLEVCPLLHLPENRFTRKADNLIVNLQGGPDLSMATVNQVLEAITDKFGSRDNTVLGAVIDDNLRQSLRICILGTTDLGLARAGARAALRPAASAPVPLPSLLEDPKPLKPASKAASDAAVKAAAAAAQNEFDFGGEEAQLGLFEKTEANLHEGQNLDVPTYLRRGIRVQI